MKLTNKTEPGIYRRKDFNSYVYAIVFNAEHTVLVTKAGITADNITQFYADDYEWYGMLNTPISSQ